MVTVYVPGARPLIGFSVLVLLHKNVTPGVPPVTTANAVPSLAPEDVSSVVATDTNSGSGAVTVAAVEAVHPVSSVTVIV